LPKACESGYVIKLSGAISLNSGAIFDGRFLTPYPLHSLTMSNHPIDKFFFHNAKSEALMSLSYALPFFSYTAASSRSCKSWDGCTSQPRFSMLCQAAYLYTITFRTVLEQLGGTLPL
jgi:hypothetical protein